MKKLAFIFILVFSVSTAIAQKTFREIKNEAFIPGEKLTFRVHYGFMDAGEATLEVDKEMKDFAGKRCYRVTGKGRSLGAFDWFFKVRDTYESFVDSGAIFPWYHIRRVQEGGYMINQNYIFNHYKNSTIVESYKKDPKAIKRDTITVPDNIQDLISAFYYARTLDFANVKAGDEFPIEAQLDDDIIPMTLKYIGTEIIKSKVGNIRCLKFRPMLQEGRVFKENESMTIWVSDDKNRIPVRVQTEILVGSIKMDIAGYSGLAHPLAIVEK